ncbi:double-stranded RNA-binding protein 2-like protein, partial [Tanacetum coccineum]
LSATWIYECIFRLGRFAPSRGLYIDGGKLRSTFLEEGVEKLNEYALTSWLVTVCVEPPVDVYLVSPSAQLMAGVRPGSLINGVPGQRHARHSLDLIFNDCYFHCTLNLLNNIAYAATLLNGQDETGVYKNLLQEVSQRVGALLPTYTTFRSGRGHLPIFTCTVELAGCIFTGEPAKNKKQAEKNAAMSAWSSLKLRAT